MAREEGNGKIQHFGKMSEQRPRSTSPSLAAYPHINYGMPPGWVMIKDISGADPCAPRLPFRANGRGKRNGTRDQGSAFPILSWR